MPELDELTKQVKRLSERLDRRIAHHKKIEPYLEGECPFPPVIEEARLTKLYRYLMPVSEAPWGSLIIDSKLDRLEISGVRDPEQDVADKAWGIWQDNGMDAESKLAHGAALLDGRAHATVWPDPETGEPDIALDDVTQMVVEYEQGSRRKRAAALRRWEEDGTVYATLYRADGIYKFQGKKRNSEKETVKEWQQREVEGEKWPLENNLGLVPCVELRVNGRLKPGRFPFARGEFAHATGLIDRINLLTFLGLVVAFWMGFPLRAVIGEKIRHRVLTDDDGNPLIDDEGKKKTEQVALFDMQPDSLVQIENPQAKLDEYKAADRKNLSIYDELQQLAVITKTPRHYFPMEGGISNIATETVNAYEGAMHAAVTGHKDGLGEGWEEVLRIAAKIKKVNLSQRAELRWKDHESRSLAERADAASKLKDVLPPMAVAELALNATQDQIGRWSSQQAVNPLLQLVAAVQNGESGTPRSAPVPANGNGAG